MPFHIRVRLSYISLRPSSIGEIGNVIKFCGNNKDNEMIGSEAEWDHTTGSSEDAFDSVKTTLVCDLYNVSAVNSIIYK